MVLYIAGRKGAEGQSRGALRGVQKVGWGRGLKLEAESGGGEGVGGGRSSR